LKGLPFGIQARARKMGEGQKGLDGRETGGKKFFGKKFEVTRPQRRWGPRGLKRESEKILEKKSPCWNW